MFLRYRDLSSMPNHSSMSPRRLMPLLGAALAVLAAAAPAQAVVGGTAVPIDRMLAVMLNHKHG